MKPQRIVRSKVSILKGEILGIYGGQVVVWNGKTHYQADIAIFYPEEEDNYRKKSRKRKEISLAVDADKKGNHLRFISSSENHIISVNGFLTDLLCPVCGCTRLVIVATRNIAAGEEIVVKYKLGLEWT
eukprot:GHVL01041158.1.p2 GENE.GHVL01041158.1~~GHVL01041158.1.p2  ORF type:complete len:129 (-),score=25.24 GHVL01041158.1:37-423(-)